MGIGISSFTEIVGAGPSSTSTSLGSRCSTPARSVSIRRARPSPASAQVAGPGPRATYAQILAEELGIPAKTLQVEGDTDTAPYGLGTYASRSTPVAGAAAMAAQDPGQGPQGRRAPPGGGARRPCVGAREVLGEGRADKSRPSRTSPSPPIRTTRKAWKPGWRRSATTIRRTSPTRSAVTSVWSTSTRDRRGQGAALRGHRRLRQHHQPDDRGGTDPRRPHHGAGPGLYEEISYDEIGNIGREFHRLLVPTAVETPKWEIGNTATPSRTIRSGPRAWASRRRWAPRPPSPTRWTRSGISASGTWTSRSPAKVWRPCGRRV